MRPQSRRGWGPGAGDELELLPGADSCAQEATHEESAAEPRPAAIPSSRSADVPRPRGTSDGPSAMTDLMHEEMVSKLLRENQELTTTIADLEAEMTASESASEDDEGDDDHAPNASPGRVPTPGGAPSAEHEPVSARARAGSTCGPQYVSAREASDSRRRASMPILSHFSSSGDEGTPSPHRLTGFRAWRTRGSLLGASRHAQPREANNGSYGSSSGDGLYGDHSGESLLERLERQRAGWGLLQRFRQREARSHDGRAAPPEHHGYSDSAQSARLLRGTGGWPAHALSTVRHVLFPRIDEEDGEDAANGGGDQGDAEEAEQATEGRELDAPAKNLVNFESYDYLDLRSRLRWEAEAQDGHKRAADREQLVDLVLSSLLMPLLIGLAVGLAAWSSNAVSNWLIEFKWKATFSLHEDHSASNRMLSYPVFAAIAVALSGAAAAISLIAPAACGSGIPHIKAVLNGIRVPGALAARTLLVKFVGITLVVASGLPAGREGPMVHIGAGVASLLLHAHSVVLSWPCCHGSSLAQARLLDEDVHKREYVSLGAAAGVAAAFNAPIGGVIFALEEVSTHWSGTLTTRSFFAAIVAAGTSNLLVSARHDGVVEDDALVVFGEYDLGSRFAMIELPIFVLIGLGGGLLGALFNMLNSRLNRWRQHAHSPRGALYALARGSRARSKVLEVAALGLLCATLSFMLPLFFGCSDTSSAISGGDGSPVAQSGSRSIDMHHILVSVQCDNPGEYNEVASITLSNQHRVVRALFSRNASGRLFSTGALLLCMVLHFCLTALCYGAAIPSGLFVPCMTIGALGGRLVGELVASHKSDAAAASAAAESLASMFNATREQGEAAASAAAAAAAAASLATADTGFYALVGAAAMLGGVTRMTISLTIIVCEISNDAAALLPIMATILTAKVVGDLFNPSLYDAAMALAGFPYVEDVLPRSLKRLRAEDVMAAGVVALPCVARAADVAAALAQTKHGAFPVIESGRTGRCRYLTGLVHRYQLHALLAMRAFSRPEDLLALTPRERSAARSRAGSRRASAREISVVRRNSRQGSDGGRGSGDAERLQARPDGAQPPPPAIRRAGSRQGSRENFAAGSLPPAIRLTGSRDGSREAFPPGSVLFAADHAAAAEPRVPTISRTREHSCKGVTPQLASAVALQSGSADTEALGAAWPGGVENSPQSQWEQQSQRNGCAGCADTAAMAADAPAAALPQLPAHSSSQGQQLGHTSPQASPPPSSPSIPSPPPSPPLGTDRQGGAVPVEDPLSSFPTLPAPSSSLPRHPTSWRSPEQQRAAEMPPAPPADPPTISSSSFSASSPGGAGASDGHGQHPFRRRSSGAALKKNLEAKLARANTRFKALTQASEPVRTRTGVSLADMLRARRRHHARAHAWDNFGARIGSRSFDGALHLLGAGQRWSAAQQPKGSWERTPGAVDPASDELPGLSEEEGELLIDLRPIMDLAPLSVLPTTPIDRLHALFRQMGLRHLFVADTRNQLVGVITRKDLLPEVLHAAEVLQHPRAPRHPDGAATPKEDAMHDQHLRVPAIVVGSSLAAPTFSAVLPSPPLRERSLTGP